MSLDILIVDDERDIRELSQASSTMRDTNAERLRIAVTRLTRSINDDRACCCWTCGCMAAKWMGWKCWMRSSSANPISR